ncbi:enoyl-CoA hydratase [Sedimentitalea sp.]|uniref:enoyl-CoA hydratase n=1 Tax=Sedimentitalea sp. TaxID=2048915 RepID=UPI00329A0709
MEELLERRVGKVCVLTINRPSRRNALYPALVYDLKDRLEELVNDSDVGAVVITGSGRAFCAGGDVKDLTQREKGTAEEEAKGLRLRSEVIRLLNEMPKVTIAMVNGPAFGAGLSMALACDLRYAAESARFSTAFAKVGLSSDFGMSYFLPRAVGSAKARELLLTAETLSSDEAFQIGMMTRVLPDDELESFTLNLAEKIGAGPSLAFAEIKHALNMSETTRLTEILDMESLRQCQLCETEDHKNAVRAFTEGGVPVFHGR